MDVKLEFILSRTVSNAGVNAVNTTYMKNKPISPTIKEISIPLAFLFMCIPRSFGS